MSDKSVSFALLESLYVVVGMLDRADGNPLRVPQQSDLRFRRTEYYDFDIGMDLYAEQPVFTLLRLKTLILDMIKLHERYRFRECDIVYRLGPRIIIMGSLKNGEGPASARQSPPDPLQYYFRQHDMVAKYYSLGDSLSLDTYMTMAYNILIIAWGLMVRHGRSGHDITFETDAYSAIQGGIHFYFVATGVPLSVMHLVQVGAPRQISTFVGFTGEAILTYDHHYRLSTRSSLSAACMACEACD